jgi:sugar diacid utilization regulator
MQVFSLEQLKKDTNGQRLSQSDLHPYLSSSESVLPAIITVKAAVYDVFRLMTTLTEAPSLQALLHRSTQMIAQVIDAGICLILLTEPSHREQYHIVAPLPLLLQREVERHPVTIPAPLLERLRDAMQQGRLLRLSTQEQDLLNPLINVDYADMWALPLILGDTSFGMILCYSGVPCQVADEGQLVLCTLARQMALAIEHHQRTEREACEQQQKEVYTFMSDLFHIDASCTEAALQKWACKLGCNLAVPHLVVSIHLLPLLGNYSVTEDERVIRTRYAATQVKRHICTQYPGSLVTDDGEHVRCLLRLEAESMTEEVNRDFDKLAEQLSNEHQVSLFAGISIPCRTVGDYRHGYAQAQEALQVVQWLKQKGGTASFNTLGIYRYLYRFAQQNTLRDQYQAQVAALADYDQSRHTNLLETLELYLECGRNIAETSEQLHIHRNTVQQRLERIQSVCLLDLSQRVHWLPLLVALKVHRLTSAGGEIR